MHHPRNGRHSDLDSSANIDVHTTNILGASRGGIAGFDGCWIPGGVLPLQSPSQSTICGDTTERWRKSPSGLWWKTGHGCSTSSLLDTSALVIFHVERSFVMAQHSCWVAISGTLHVASDPTIYSPSAFDQVPNPNPWVFPPLGLQAQSSSGI